MQTLEVTDEQYAVIQQLREEISEQVVGKYGFVRERDAIQFLIDNLEGNPDVDVELDAELDSSATDDVAASVGAAIDGESPPDDLEEVSYIEDESVDGTDDATADADVDAADAGAGTVGPDSATEPDVGESDESGDDDAEGEDASDDTDAASEDDAGAADAGESDDADESDSGDGSADDDDMLDEMMSLLETHDDKWSESSSADYRYEVELPDGSVEQVQTKDDVRALLFKNYR